MDAALQLILMGGTSSASGGGSAFSPLDLTPALWIDPSDTATMFQSNAGTTTVTDTSVCGYAGDKSGNAFHLTSAANDTTRPTWNNNSGLPYLNFDGTNDVLRFAGSVGLFAAGASSIFVAARGNPATGTHLFAEGGSVNNTFAGWLLSDATTASTLRYTQRNDAAASNVITLATSIWDNTDKVVGNIDSGSTATGYANGVAGTPQTATRSGVFTLDRASLGALFRATASVFFASRVYGLVAVNRVLTAGEIASLNTYLGAKMGLVL